MSGEVTLSTFFVTVDVVQGVIDYNALQEYMKSNFKKEIVILNAQDFNDQAAKAVKTDSKTGSKSRSEANAALVKAIKAKIDSDYPKQLEAKRKAIAALEKAKSQSSSKGGRPKSRSNREDDSNKSPAVFDGQIDILYVLNGFPYLPMQLKQLFEGGIELNAFVSIVPSGEIEKISYHRKTVEKSSRTAVKKTQIHGNELDFQLNPNLYPPARWEALRTDSPAEVAFVEIVAGETIDQTFAALEEQVVKIHRAKASFKEFLNGRELVSLLNSHIELDVTAYNEYLNVHPGDFMGGVYYQLKQHEYHVISPPSPPTIQDIYDSIFEKAFQDTTRTVNSVSLRAPSVLEPEFIMRESPIINGFIYQLKHWQIRPENALAVKAISAFIEDQSHFHAYSGQKFDSLYTTLNKKYGLGLPLSFFDWQKWNLSAELGNLSEVSLDFLSDSTCVSTLFDDNAGILFVLAVPPISRFYMHYLSKTTMPLTMDGLTDYLGNLFEKERETKNVKKAKLNPSAIVQQGSGIQSLLPDTFEKFTSHQSIIYNLPLSISQSCQTVTPYHFSKDLRVDVHRDVESGQMKFTYEAFYRDLLKATSQGDSIMLSMDDVLHVLVEDNLSVTVLFYDKSLKFENGMMTLKALGEQPMIITDDGSMILTGTNMVKTIVYANGTVARQLDGVWTFVDSSGLSYRKMFEGVEEVNDKSVVLTNLKDKSSSMVRPDGIDYVITSSYRRIFPRVDLYVVQEMDEFSYFIPGFPDIKFKNGVFSVAFQSFLYEFSSEKVDVACGDCKIEIKDRVSFKSEDCEMFLSKNKGEFKLGADVLVVDELGNEVFGEIEEDLTSKKKQLVESSWGKVNPQKGSLNEAKHCELLKIFQPRFLAIRSDSSVVEFFREDVIDGQNTRKDTVPILGGHEFEVISTHGVDQHPQVFVVNEALSKINRSNLLKSLHVPKAGKKFDDKDLEEASSEHQKLLTNRKVEFETLVSHGDAANAEYLESLQPEEAPEQMEIRLPPQTPSPRLLEMAANLYVKNTPVSGSGTILSYWDSPEAVFAKELDLDASLPRPLSPRVHLYDPPRFSRPVKDVPEEPQPVEREKTPEAKPRSPLGPLRPQTIQTYPRTINFGTVKANTRSRASIVVTNTDVRPLRYSISQPDDPHFKVLSIPGIVFPGLKCELTVELEPSEPQSLYSVFQFITADFRMDIPVTAVVE